MKKPENNTTEQKIRNVLTDYKPEFKEEYWGMMQEKLDSADSNKRKTKNLSFIKYAASIVLLIGLCTYIPIYLYSNKNIETYTQDKTQISLADKSKIILNRTTKFSYPEKFSRKTRKVSLEGEAYFEVEKDSTKPYIINTQSSQITVLGTKFNVQAYDHEKLEVVSVVEGKVMVQLLNSNKSVILKKGEKSVIDKKNNTILKSQINDENFIAWHTDILYFRNTPLDSVALSLSKHYNKVIIVNDDKLKATKLTSTIYNQELNDALQIIAFTLNIQTETRNDSIFIKNN